MYFLTSLAHQLGLWVHKEKGQQKTVGLMCPAETVSPVVNGEAEQ